MFINSGTMPTYGYHCEKCGQEFEIVQPISAKSLTVCPKDSCRQKVWGKGRVKRSISTGGGLLFKGSGFYITDYRSDNYKAGAKKDSVAPATPSGDAKSTKTGDTPAAAPSAAPAKPAKETKSKAADAKS
jgi:putative FmdB family regulatory protein